MIKIVQGFVKRNPRKLAFAGAIPFVPIFAYYTPITVELKAFFACLFLLGVIVYVDIKSDPV